MPAGFRTDTADRGKEKIVPDTDALEPLGYYRQTLKAALEKNAADYFDALTERAGIDKEATDKRSPPITKRPPKPPRRKRRTMPAGRGARPSVSRRPSCLSSARGLSWSAVQAFAWWKALAAAVCTAGAVTAVVLLATALRRGRQTRRETAEAAAAAAQALYDEAMAQLAPLHALYTFGMSRDIIEKTYPALRIDDGFDGKKFERMQREYGLRENDDQDCSTLCLLSGTAGRHPFLYVRTLRGRLYTATYTGSLVIRWTTTTRDSQGRTHTVEHSQTLTATYSAPAPRYEEETRLYYGNEAAPDLSFSRRPHPRGSVHRQGGGARRKKGAEDTAKERSRGALLGRDFHRNGQCGIRRAVRRSRPRQRGAVPAAVHAACAEEHGLALLRSDEAYGDDFAFIKEKCLNCIRSDHAQQMPFETDPVRFVGHDLEASRAAFIAWQREYFRSIYFDLAPLLAIPAYAMQKPRDFIYKDVYGSNCSPYRDRRSPPTAFPPRCSPTPPPRRAPS